MRECNCIYRIFGGLALQMDYRVHKLCHSSIIDPTGRLWICTLPPQHEGNHIACTPELHFIFEWHTTTLDGSRLVDNCILKETVHGPTRREKIRALLVP